jgi:hypothetical protein
MHAMVDYLRLYPDKSIRMRLKLAQILSENEHRPATALKVLSKIDLYSLPPDLQAVFQKLSARAKQLQDECDVELATDEDDW